MGVVFFTNKQENSHKLGMLFFYY